MDVKEAIEILKDENRDICYGTTLADEATKLAVEIMERTRWIPVSERLPEKNGQYLVYSGWVRTLLCMYGVWGCNPDEVTVTHWMQLPSVPQEVDL